MDYCDDGYTPKKYKKVNSRELSPKKALAIDRGSHQIFPVKNLRTRLARYTIKIKERQ